MFSYRQQNICLSEVKSESWFTGIRDWKLKGIDSKRNSYQFINNYSFTFVRHVILFQSIKILQKRSPIFLCNFVFSLLQYLSGQLWLICNVYDIIFQAPILFSYLLILSLQGIEILMDIKLLFCMMIMSVNKYVLFSSHLSLNIL